MSEAEKNPPVPETPAAEQPQAPADTPESLAREAEDFCAALEKFFRRGFGDMPSSTDLAEMRAQQASVRDLVRRASENNPAALGNPVGIPTFMEDLKLAQKRGVNLRDKKAIVEWFVNSKDKSNMWDRQAAEIAYEKWFESWQEERVRAQADFLNYQERARKDLQRAEEQALRGYVSELLPILDSLDLALKDARSDNANLETVRQALTMIGDSFNQVLKVRGLERLPATGQPYDPTRHEAVHVRPADTKKDEKPSTVVEEFRSGYLWKGLVLRPAQVVVTQAEAKK